MILIDPQGSWTAGEMLRPTLSHSGRYQCAVCNGHVCVILLDPESFTDTTALDEACALHSAIGRGLLVVVPHR